MKMTWSTTPRDQTSERSASAGLMRPVKASGAMYSVVPIFGVSLAPVVRSNIRERPKSMSFSGGWGSRSHSRRA